MTIFPHAIAGAAIATSTTNPAVAFLLGLVSHFLLDAMPHLEPSSQEIKHPDGTTSWSIWLYLFVVGEFILTVAVFVFLYYYHRPPDISILLWGAFGGLFPDLIVTNPVLFPYKKYPVMKQIVWFHDKIHLYLRPQLWYVGLIFESVLIGGSLWYLLKF